MRDLTKLRISIASSLKMLPCFLEAGNKRISKAQDRCADLLQALQTLCLRPPLRCRCTARCAKRWREGGIGARAPTNLADYRGSNQILKLTYC